MPTSQTEHDQHDQHDHQQQQGAGEPDVLQRVSYLDVVEQQLEAMKVQALATIAICDTTLATVRLLKSHLETARKLADERRQQQQETEEPKRPATFGSHRRSPQER